MASQLSFSELESILTQSTDPSSTLSTNTSTFDSTRRTNVTREELKKRELLHTIELLKLELSQKNLLIDTLKQEHETTVLELEEKLNDVHHEKVMYSTQLALLKRGFEEEIRKLQQKSQKDVERLNRQICDFEEFQLKSSQQNEDIKLSLQAPLMTEGKYRVLRAKQVEDLTVEEHVLMRYYELCQEHIQRSAKLESETQQLREDNRDKEGELNHLEQVQMYVLEGGGVSSV